MKESEHSAMKVLESHYQVTKAHQLGHTNKKTLQAGGCLMKGSDLLHGFVCYPKKIFHFSGGLLIDILGSLEL